LLFQFIGGLFSFNAAKEEEGYREENELQLPPGEGEPTILGRFSTLFGENRSREDGTASKTLGTF
jgi:hypothetical protein